MAKPVVELTVHRDFGFVIERDGWEEAGGETFHFVCVKWIYHNTRKWILLATTIRRRFLACGRDKKKQQIPVCRQASLKASTKDAWFGMTTLTRSLRQESQRSRSPY